MTSLTRILKLVFCLLFGAFIADLSCFAQGSSFCEKTLVIDDSTKVISYLQQLVEGNILDLDSIQGFVAQLEKGTLSNPISIEATRASAVHLIHAQTLEKLLRAPETKQRRLLVWARAFLANIERMEVERERSRTETKVSYEKMKFLPIPPGEFWMGELGKKDVKVILTHPIEVMTTPVTQWQWVEVMGQNPSWFKDGRGPHGSRKKEQWRHEQQPDCPVEWMTWWSAVVYANQTSKRFGLPPAYDLRGIDFVDMSEFDPEKKKAFSDRKTILHYAARGTLAAAVRNAFPRINAPGGNIYLAKGFRLPTEAEQEYLMRKAGVSTGEYYTGDRIEELKNHAWYGDNSGKTPQMVSQLRPMIINGNAFYDVLGNVDEWGHDALVWGGGDLRGGANPVGAIASSPSYLDTRPVRGGGWSAASVLDLSARHRRYDFADSRFSHLGLRLVRTIRGSLEKSKP